MVWDLKHLKMVKEIEGIEDEISLIALTKDGKKAIISIEQRLEIWNLEDGNNITLGNHNFKISSLSISMDGKSAISVSNEDETFKIWDLEALKETRSWTAPIKDLEMNELTSVAIDVDCPYGLGIYDSSYLIIWDINSGEMINPNSSYDEDSSMIINAVALSAYGKYAFVGERNRIKILDINREKEIGSLESHPDFILDISISPNGNFMLCSTNSSSIYFYNLEKKLDNKQKGHFEWITALSMSSDEKYVISGAFDRNIKVWELKTGRELCSRTENDSYGTTFDALAISPDNKHFFSAQKLGKLKYWNLEKGWNLENGKEYPSLDYGDHTYDVTFTFEGKQIISIHPNKVNVFEIQGTNMTVYSKKLPISLKNIFAISPAGFFINRTKENRISIWDLNKGWAQTVLEGHKEIITSIALSPDGLRLISGASDGSCKVWDIKSGKELSVLFNRHNEEVYAITTSADGLNVASISKDNVIKIWKIENGKEIGHTKIDINDKIESFQINKDGTSI